MSQCVVRGCASEGVIIAGKPTPWGAWEYWVCGAHKAQVDAGAEIQDHSDGRTITLVGTTGPAEGAPAPYRPGRVGK